MSEDSLATDIRWIKQKLDDIDGKFKYLVDKDTCTKAHLGYDREFDAIKKMIDRRLKEKAPANEFNIVKLLVFGYTGIILAFAVRSWLQTLFVSNAGNGTGIGL